MCMAVLPVCTSVHCVCTVPMVARKGQRLPRNRSWEGCQPSGGCWESNQVLWNSCKCSSPWVISPVSPNHFYISHPPPSSHSAIHLQLLWVCPGASSHSSCICWSFSSPIFWILCTSSTPLSLDSTATAFWTFGGLMLPWTLIPIFLVFLNWDLCIWSQVPSLNFWTPRFCLLGYLPKFRKKYTVAGLRCGFSQRCFNS